MPAVLFFAGLIVSYFIGSFPTAYLVGRLAKGIDIRSHGSGNVGATNVFRIVGKKWGIGVLFFDMLKGYFAAGLAPLFLSSYSINDFLTRLLFGLAAIVGHTWPIWLGFRGGKGVAASLGVFLALAPQATGVSLLVWVLIFASKRYVSLASLGMALSFPLGVIFFYRKTDFFGILFPVALGLTAFIFYTHRENLQRLREGSEKRLF